MRAWRLRSKGPSAAVSQQAHFTALDGTIRVRKGNGNSWINADYNVPLEKGDVVQTGAEGMAKIVFNDGTNYTVKQDSLIVIEENSANDQQQTNVSVAVTTGTVDLTTATYVQGSKSQVIVAGAKASLAPDSSAMVHNNPKDDQHEILVKKGSGEIERNGEVVHLSNWEKVSFQSESKTMERATEIGPPTPITPGNMMPVFINAGEKSKEVEFAWTPMANAAGYRLRISHNPYFSSLLLDRKVETPSVVVTGLPVGAYYWSIQSYDAAGKESVESEKNRFTHHCQGEGKNRAVARNRSSGPARTRDRSDGQDRGGSARHGERQGSADRRRRWYVPLFHAALAERGKPGHGHGAEFQRRSEHPPGKSGDSVRDSMFRNDVRNNRCPNDNPVLLNIEVE